MNRVRSAAVAVAVLLTTAIAAPAVAGVAVAQEQPAENRTIDECTTIEESGVYELNGSIGTNESANATNETAEASEVPAENNATDGTANDTDAAMETGVVEDDVNASACIAVEASDVTFDGSGYTLDGSNVSALNLSDGDAANETAESDANESVVNGIVVRPASGDETVSNVTITNVTVQHWYVGVYVQNTTNLTLDNVTFADNTVPGFRLVNATDVTISEVNQTSVAGT
jgi:hypothetical protein